MPGTAPLCFYDPRHGRGTARVTLREELEVPACRACAADVRAGRTPDVLRDGTRPWLETESPWARTGLGLRDDELAARVLRGEAHT